MCKLTYGSYTKKEGQKCVSWSIASFPQASSIHSETHLDEFWFGPCSVLVLHLDVRIGGSKFKAQVFPRRVEFGAARCLLGGRGHVQGGRRRRSGRLARGSGRCCQPRCCRRKWLHKRVTAGQQPQRTDQGEQHGCCWYHLEHSVRKFGKAEERN